MTSNPTRMPSQVSPAVAEELAAIAEVVQLNFDGIHHGDVAKLERVFHADAYLIGEVNGQHTAVVKLLTPVGTNDYVDYLSMLWIGDAWGVVHKLFSNEVASSG